ncbi:MAG: hypothetical protein RLZZ01_2057, partial [Actinomycetota bacterium]
MTKPARHPVAVFVLAGSVAIAVSGCAENFSDAAPDATAAGPAVDGSARGAEVGPDGDRDPLPAGSADDDVRTVAVDLVVPAEFLAVGTGSVAWSGQPAVDAVDGPFGRFGSCSGWRDVVSAYSVVVSTGSTTGASDELAAVVIWTSDRLEGPGEYDVEVRLERADGEAWLGSGTAVLADDLRSGAVDAVAPDGTAVSGGFECSGPLDPIPVGSAPVVEIFALLRSEGSERVLGLVTPETAAARCAGSDGSTSVTASVDAGQGGMGFF